MNAVPIPMGQLGALLDRVINQFDQMTVGGHGGYGLNDALGLRTGLIFRRCV